LNGAGSNKVGNNNNCTGTLIIDAGGIVNADSGWMMIAGNSNVTGIAEVSGTLNINGHLWMATGAGSSATLDIYDGGVVNVGQNIGLGTIAPANAETGGPATITVHEGGFLNLHHWDNTGSIRDGSVLNVNSGGVVVVGGNRVNAVNDYIAAGKIATNAAELLVSFSAEFNETTITTPRLPLVAEISPAGTDLLLSWNGRSDSLYNVWSTADLSEDPADWDEVESGSAGSETTVTPGSSPLFYRVEEYPKPPAVTNGSFSEPGGIAADGFDVIGEPWVVDDAGLIETWNPEDPISYNGKPGGPNVAHIASNYEANGTPFGISQVLNETFAENASYTLTVRVGRSHLYDWPGYRVELWAGTTLLAFDDDTISSVPVAGKFGTSRLDYEAGTITGIAAGTPLEIRLLSRNVDVENVAAPEYDWAVDFDNVGFRSSAP
jgi:hypothetical protein